MVVTIEVGIAMNPIPVFVVAGVMLLLSIYASVATRT